MTSAATAFAGSRREMRAYSGSAPDEETPRPDVGEEMGVSEPPVQPTPTFQVGGSSSLSGSRWRRKQQACEIRRATR